MLRSEPPAVIGCNLWTWGRLGAMIMLPGIYTRIQSKAPSVTGLYSDTGD
jgi:hypothetical protein